MLDPDVPSNQGMLDAIEIEAPAGSFLNARHPSAVAGRANTCQRIIDVVIGALSPALPLDTVGAANGANTATIFSGTDPRTGRSYVYLETVGGGFGGRATTDGKDDVQVHLINTSNLPIEAIETEYPLIVESYGFIPDSGGAGKFRGGLGLRRVIKPAGHTTVFTGQGDRFLNAPWGVFGGGEGGRGGFLKRGPDGVEVRLPTKPGPTPVDPDEALIVETAGAAGYGSAADRSAEALKDDLASGKFSADYMRRHYPGKL
jgi:N-methylhydantoinase B